MSTEKRRYILYGTGGEAERFLFQNQDILDRISFCIDRRNTGKFHGISVYSSDEVTLCDYMETHCLIVAAGSMKVFTELKRKLCAQGLKEWEHFLWSKVFRKKVVVINANCHGEAIEKYLNLSPSFCNEYMIYPLLAVHLNLKGEIEPELLKHTDVYIHQDIRVENEMGYKLSDEYVKGCLPEHVTDICIPNFVGMGRWMYPALGGLDKVINSMQGPLYVLYKDAVLDEAVDCCERYEEFRTYWMNYSYEDDRLEEIFAVSMNKLKERERNWDIKIYDFIERNYRKIPCFTDANHPSKYVMKEVGRQLAERMGLSDINDENYESSLGLRVPVLNCILTYYNLEFEVCSEVRNEYLGKRVVEEIDDYIKAYLWWYHGISMETGREEII